MLRCRAAPSAFGPCNMRALLFAAFFAGAAEAEDFWGQDVDATRTTSTCLNLMSYSYLEVYDDDQFQTSGSCAVSFYIHSDPEDDWGYNSPGCYGQANFGCQSCDGGDPWCQSVDADGEHTGWCYCSDDDAAGDADVLAYTFESFDGTNTGEACIPAPEWEQNPYGPVDGRAETNLR